MTARGLSLLSLAILGCGGDDPKVTPDAAEDYTLGEAPALARACTDTLANVYTLPTDLPTMDDSHRGDVFRCAITEKLTVPEIKAQIEEYNANKFNTTYVNQAPGTIKSGFWSYRVAYRTTRGGTAARGTEGDSAALLLVPAKPLPGAPLVVFGHGSAGFAEKCAASRLDLTAPVTDQDYPPMLYRLAGYGFTVIAPDYSGFSYGQAPGYFNAEDEARSVLDATRAAAKILMSPPDKVAFVGHSQGAHAMLSAHSYAKSYGMQGELVGVATLAPMWMSLSLFAAGTTDNAGLMTAKASDLSSILYTMAYAYSSLELHEGVGHGVDVFQTAKQADAKAVIVGGECYDMAKMQALGTRPSDFFDSAYVSAVGFNCAAYPFPNCGTATDPAGIWKARWEADRPSIDPKGAPILATFGGKDTFITPGRAQCARDKFAKDLAVSGATTQIEYCFNDAAQHRDIIRGTDVDRLAQWIAAKAGAGPEPEACAAFPTGQICETPPNDF